MSDKPTKLKLILDKRNISQSQLKICVALNVTPNELIEKDEFIETQLK